MIALPKVGYRCSGCTSSGAMTSATDGTYLKATLNQPLLKQTSKEREANNMKQTFVLLFPSNSKSVRSAHSGQEKVATEIPE